MEYLYALYTDSQSNVNIVDVYESHLEGDRSTPLTQRYRDGTSIDGFWSFDRETGRGPFNSYYAAVNILGEGGGYAADDHCEKRLDHAAGTVAYILDPDDLTKTLAGHTFDRELYNVMLMVPTVYWTSARVTAESAQGNLAAGTEYNVLYLSSSPAYTPSGHGTVTGMKAYAHSASLESGKTDFESNVYPLLGFGVYESYATGTEDAVGAGLLVSQRSRIPASGLTVDEFKDLADALSPAGGKGVRPCYQQWNYYQWTLYKMMCYTVLGSMNSQGIVGEGFTTYSKADSSAVTGSTDRTGFAGTAASTENASGVVSSEAGRTSSKVFLENGWGSLNLFVGDAYVAGDSYSTQRLYAGNYLGGEKLLGERKQPSASQIWADINVTGDVHRVISSTSVQPSTWGTPVTADGNSEAYGSLEFPGDIVNARESGVSSITVGGRWDNGHYSGLSFSCAGYDISLANEFRGARLAYLLSSL